MDLREPLAQVNALLLTLQQSAVDAAGMTDQTTIPNARRGYAAIAAGLAQARMQLTFVTNLIEGQTDADHRRTN